MPAGGQGSGPGVFTHIRSPNPLEGGSAVFMSPPAQLFHPQHFWGVGHGGSSLLHVGFL